MPIGKLAILKLDGDLEQQGFRVSLEISCDGDRPFSETSGFLPPAPALAAQLKQWQGAYRTLGGASRIKPKEIVYGGSIQQRSECRRWAAALSDRFTHWLTSDSFRAIDLRLREALSLSEPIRVLIRTDDRYVRRLPWHLWDFIDRYKSAEIAFSAPIAQRIAADSPTSDRVRILAILGSSSGIDIAADRQMLTNLPHADVRFLVEPERQQINHQLWDQPWHILFFAGHSETEAEQGRIHINADESLTLDELRYGLRQAIAQGLRLAIFNSCDGLGLVHELEQLNLPQIIVMREPVPDRIAQEFLKQFLMRYAQGDSLYLAVRRARERLQGWEGEFPCASWLPVICQNASETPPDWQCLRSAQPAASSLARQGCIPAPPLWKSLRLLLIVAALVTSLVMGVRSLGWLQSFELRSFDQLVRLRPVEPPDDRIVVIGVGEADIQYQDQIGMERRGSLADRALLQVMQRLEPHQPRAIGLDIYHDFEFSPDLAQTIGATDGFFAICQVQQSEDSPSIAPPPGLPPEHIGFSDSVTDADGVTRRHLLGMSSSPTCPTSLSLSLRIAGHYLAQSGTAQMQRTATGALMIGSVLFPKLSHNAGGYQLTPAEANGYQILLNYRASSPPRLALRDLLSGALDAQLAEQVRDRIILIGVTADNVDAHSTPYQLHPAQRIPGVTIQAQMISQLISAVLDQRPLLWWLPEWAECAWIGAWAVAGGVLAIGWQFVPRSRMRSLWLGSAVVLSLGILFGCCWLLLLRGGWLPLIPAAIAFLAASAGVSFWSSTNQGAPPS